MRTALLILLNLFLTSIAFGQDKSIAKLYFYCFPSVELSTTSNPSDPIKIGRCTLIETNLDSLGLKVLKNKTIYIPLKLGQTYYFRRIIGSYTTVSATATLSTCSEEDFWLNGYFSGIGTYRHYFLDKTSGLKLLADEK